MKSLLAALLAAAGCQATFIDYRADAAAHAGADLAGADLGDTDLAGALETVLASGRFEGRDGHAGTGGGRLVRTAAGDVEVRLDPDFSTSSVPGPVVVLSTSDDLGTQLTTAEQDLGALRSTNGAQAYPVPGGDSGRRNLFVYCKPFGVEVARAVLTP